MLHLLPAEIALQAISYLPLHSVYPATLVSRAWNSLIAINEPTVYRNVAILHHFINADRLGVDSAPTNWKAYCRRQLEIQRGWRGKAPSVVRELTATGTMVHRIKIDYELGFIITTCQTGGLFVCDIRSNRVLWALPPSHVAQYAHLEYDRGYIVFNRHDNCKEVWRRSIDADRDPHPGILPPDQKMLEASVRATESYDSADSRHGHFKCWALLRVPENSRAFRLLYPTLLAAATHNAYLWDVTTLELVSVIRDIQQQYHGLILASINYVEVSDLYVFVCGAGSLRVFAREDGALLYQLSTRELSSATWDVLPQPRGLASSAVHPQMLLHNHHSPNSFHGEFMACHVLASGNDLAALTTNGKLVLLPDYQRLFSGSNSVHHRDIATILNFQPFSSDGDISCYLAVGGRDGKLAIATRKGIYAVSLDVNFTPLTADRPPEPGVFVCRLSDFEDDRLLFFISCLQITHDAIYFTYKPSPSRDSLDAAHQAHLHGGTADDDDDDDPPDVEEFADATDIMDDGLADGWVVEEPEDEEDEEEWGIGDDDPVHAIIHHLFLPTASNTVYSVSF